MKTFGRCCISAVCSHSAPLGFWKNYMIGQGWLTSEQWVGGTTFQTLISKSTNKSHLYKRLHIFTVCLRDFLTPIVWGWRRPPFYFSTLFCWIIFVLRIKYVKKDSVLWNILIEYPHWIACFWFLIGSLAEILEKEEQHATETPSDESRKKCPSPIKGCFLQNLICLPVVIKKWSKHM